MDKNDPENNDENGDKDVDASKTCQHLEKEVTSWHTRGDTA